MSTVPYQKGDFWSPNFELVLTDLRGLPINPHDTRDMLKSIGKNEQQFCEWIGEENMAKTGYAYSMLVSMVDTNKYYYCTTAGMVMPT